MLAAVFDQHLQLLGLMSHLNKMNILESNRSHIHGRVINLSSILLMWLHLLHEYLTCHYEIRVHLITKCFRSTQLSSIHTIMTADIVSKLLKLTHRTPSRC